MEDGPLSSADRQAAVRPEVSRGDTERDVRLVAKGGGLQAVGLVCNRVLQFFFAAVAVRVLAAGGYGLYRQAAQVLTIAATIGLAGFHFGAMRYVALGMADRAAGAIRGSVRVALTSAVVASIAIATVILVGAEQIAGLFVPGEANREELALLLRIGVAYIPLFAVMHVLTFSTQGYKTVGPTVIVNNILQPGVRFVAGAIALFAGWQVAGAVATLVLSLGVGALGGAYYYFRLLPHEERRARPAHPVKRMLRFSIPQGGAALLSIQSMGFGIIVLGARSSDEQVGLFAVALALQAPGLVAQSAIQTIWAPLVSDLYFSGQKDRLESIFQTITRWLATLSLPFLAIMVVEPDPFVRLFAGDAAAGAATVAAVLAAGNLFFTGTGPTGHVISMIGRPEINLVNSVVATALYVGLGLVFVPRYGAVGMAAVDAGVTVLVNFARIVECKLLAGIQPFGKTFVKPLAATAAGVVVLLLWKLVPGESTMLDLAGIAVAGGVMLVVLKLAGLDPEERLVWTTVRARIGRRRRTGEDSSG